MARGLVNGWNRARLRLALLVFFVALVAPTAVLVSHAYGQLKWEAFHRHQALADELVARVDDRLAALVRAEEARSFADYAFLNVAGQPQSKLLQRSPLAAWPVTDTVPGLLGYFQVDAEGRLTSPLLPPADADAAGVDDAELRARAQRVARMQRVLAQHSLVPAAAVALAPASPSAERWQYVESAAPSDRVGLRDRDERMARQAAGSLVEPPAEAKTEAGAPPRPVEPERRRETHPLQPPALASARLREDATARAPVTAPSRLREDTAASAPAAAPARAGDESPERMPGAQAAFDRLTSAVSKQRADVVSGMGRVEDLNLAQTYAAPEAEEADAAAAAGEPARAGRKEKVSLPAAPALSGEGAAAGPAPAITTFESELDPFEFSLLGSGHLVLFRKVWRDGERYIQGLLIEQGEFLARTVEQPFRATTLALTTSLAVAWRGDVLAAWRGQAPRDYLASAADMDGALLRRARLSAPLSELELVFSVRRLPVGAGAGVLGWSAGVLALVLTLGFVLMYRAGCRQIDLAHQQQDFVAAVSHELKTPLTSIRMYGEMLREGWVADEQRRRGYYDYIVDESERLSRLIGNVLQLARMTRGGIDASLAPVAVQTLAAQLRDKVAAQVERAGFSLSVAVDEAVAGRSVLVDEDFVSQVVINLVDNALKFSRRAERLAVEIAFRPGRDDGVVLSVRDHGPGVPRRQMKRIFRLFYRVGSELTRETAGTGIGLALVRELARAMGASVDVVNREPGAEFLVHLRGAAGASS